MSMSIKTQNYVYETWQECTLFEVINSFGRVTCKLENLTRVVLIITGINHPLSYGAAVY